MLITKYVPHKAFSCNCFCTYPLFHRGNIIQKCKSEGLKKVLKKGSRRFAIGKRAIYLDENYEMEEFCNHFRKTLRLFNVLPNFHFTTRETMSDYCL